MKIQSSVLQGIKWGSGIALLLSLWAIVLAFLHRDTTFSTRGQRIDLRWIVIAYWGVGLLAGIVFGALRTFIRFRLVAAFLGAAVTTPFGAAILITRANYSAWGRVETFSAILFPIIFGIPAGLILQEFMLEADAPYDS